MSKYVSAVSLHIQIFYLSAFLVGMVISLLVPSSAFIPGHLIVPENISTAGFFLMLIATFLIVSSQKAGSIFRKVKKDNFKKNELQKNELQNNKKLCVSEDFMHGPYKYMHHPTYVGSMLLAVGFSLMTGLIYVGIVSVVAFIFVVFFWQRKEERILCANYGEAYEDYLKKGSIL